MLGAVMIFIALHKNSTFLQKSLDNTVKIVYTVNIQTEEKEE